MTSADFWELFGMIRYRFGSEGWGKTRKCRKSTFARVICPKIFFGGCAPRPRMAINLI